MRRVALLSVLLLLVGSVLAIAADDLVALYAPDADWFSAGEALSAPVPEGLTEREAALYRAGYANGHHAALHPAYVEGMYVLNTRTKKFHFSDCLNTLQIATENREHFYGTREEVIALGYEPCGGCKP